MTITQDVLSHTVCDLVPGTIRWGPGWYLIAANDRVECGPFSSEIDAAAADWYLDENGLGVHPGPWVIRWSRTGLMIGSRIRDRK